MHQNQNIAAENIGSTTQGFQVAKLKLPYLFPNGKIIFYRAGEVVLSSFLWSSFL